MKKNLLTLLSGLILSVCVGVSPVYAQWPTTDIGEIINTITSSISQFQAQVSTTMETYSIANLQQAFGDKLGSIAKLKDVKEKLKEGQEKIEKARKRLEKVKKLKEEYEAKVKKTLQDAKDAYSTAQGYVHDVENQVQNAKNQVENTVNGVKNQVENAKNKVENTVNNVKNQVEDAKNKVENTVNNVKNQVEDAKDRIDFFISDEDDFDFEAAQQGNVNMLANTSSSGQSGYDNNMQIISGSAHSNENASASSGRNLSSDIVEWGDGISNGSEPEAVLQTGYPGNESVQTVVDMQTNGVSKLSKERADELLQWGDDVLDDTDTKVDAAEDEVIEILKDRKAKAQEQTQIQKEINETIKKDASPAIGRTQVKAFDKVSFYQNIKAGYAAASSSFKTGTDDEGNFYFPDAYAQWIGLNYDDTMDADQLWAGINKICADLKSAENQETGEFDRKFDYEIVGQMRATAQAHSTVSANEAESGKRVDDLSNMVDTCGGTETMQVSGNGELEVSQIHQNKPEIVRLSDEFMSNFFDGIRSYCYGWPYKEDDKQ